MELRELLAVTADIGGVIGILAMMADGGTVSTTVTLVSVGALAVVAYRLAGRNIPVTARRASKKKRK